MLAGFYPLENSGGGQGLTQAVTPVGKKGRKKKGKKRKKVNIFHCQCCLPNVILGHSKSVHLEPT
jgi:DUF1680 family protein